jgi:hypothetical protein
MRNTGILTALTVILVATVGRAGEDRATGTATNKQVLYMKHIGGWDAGVLCEFSVEDAGAFWWKAKKDNRAGIIPKTELDKLIATVVSAGAGTVAFDAGTVEFKWIDRDGKEGSRGYSYPQKDPCQRLLAEIAVLTAKYKAGDPK